MFVGSERGVDGRFNVAYWSKESTQGKFYTYTTNEKGDRLELLLPTPDYDLLKRPWYNAAKKAQKPTWGSIYVWSAPYPNIALPAVKPIYDSEGNLEGVFAVDISLLDIEITQKFKNGSLCIAKATLIMERGMVY